jgi:Dullard-like phosphatase family protein
LIIPKPSIPYLPKKNESEKREYCLVLDLDETLVHYIEEEDEDNAYVKVRMGVEDFINSLSEYCEIVIFTASTQYYADIVIDGLQCKDKIDYKLYRQHTDFIDGTHFKDLSKLGRNLSKIIIIDNLEDNYQLQPKNGLNIIDFEGDDNDYELIYLKQDLLNLVKVPGLDVRNELDSIRRNMRKRYIDLM